MVKIVDFGLAHVSEATATLTHGAVGTLDYIRRSRQPARRLTSAAISGHSASP